MNKHELNSWFRHNTRLLKAAQFASEHKLPHAKQLFDAWMADFALYEKAKPIVLPTTQPAAA